MLRLIKFKTLLSILSILFFLFLISACVQPRVIGTIQDINIVSGTITILTDQGDTRVFKIDQSTTAIVHVPIKSLESGSEVNILLKNDGSTVQEISDRVPDITN